MLTDSCLIQAIKGTLSDTACGSGDPVGGDAGDSETDSETSDQALMHGLNNCAAPPTNNNDNDDCGPVESWQQSPAPPANDNNDNNSGPVKSQQPSPTLPTNNNNNACGPVESGPLMNKVHFVGRKGKSHPPQMTCKLRYYL